jgi:hypothetical protein
MADEADRKGVVQPELDNEKTTVPSSGSEESLADIYEGRLLRKLDIRLLPTVGILYLLSFLDRSNVGNARIEGLATDLNMSRRCTDNWIKQWRC